jgi:hypothetical protein
LNDHRVDEKSVSEGRPCIPSDESHEKSKADQNHEVNVLKVSVKVEFEIRIVLDFIPDKNRVHDKDNNFDKNEQIRVQLSIGEVCLVHAGFEDDMAIKYFFIHIKRF